MKERRGDLYPYVLVHMYQTDDVLNCISAA